MSIEGNKRLLATTSLMRNKTIFAVLVASMTSSALCHDTLGLIPELTPPPRTITQSPSSADDMIARMDWAAAILDPVQSAPHPLTDNDKHYALLTLKFAVDPLALTTTSGPTPKQRQSWQSDPHYLQSLENLTHAVLSSKICGVESMPMIFDAIELLPDSARCSELIISALSLHGSWHRVWSNNLHARITQEDTEKILSEVSDSDLDNIHLWKIAILVTTEHPRSLSVVSAYQDRLQAHEGNINDPRPLGNRRSDMIQGLILLKASRNDPDALLEWAVDHSVLGGSPVSFWAANEALSKAGPQSSIWHDVWSDIVQQANNASVNYFSGYAIQPAQEKRDLYIANWIRPWAVWYREHNLSIPQEVSDYLYQHVDLSRAHSHP